MARRNLADYTHITVTMPRDLYVDYKKILINERVTATENIIQHIESVVKDNEDGQLNK